MRAACWLTAASIREDFVFLMNQGGGALRSTCTHCASAGPAVPAWNRKEIFFIIIETKNTEDSPLSLRTSTEIMHENLSNPAPKRHCRNKNAYLQNCRGYGETGVDQSVTFIQRSLGCLSCLFTYAIKKMELVL